MSARPRIIALVYVPGMPMILAGLAYVYALATTNKGAEFGSITLSGQTYAVSAGHGNVSIHWRPPAVSAPPPEAVPFESGPRIILPENDPHYIPAPPSRWMPPRSYWGLAGLSLGYHEYQPGLWVRSCGIWIRCQRITVVVAGLFAASFILPSVRAALMWWLRVGGQALTGPYRLRSSRRGFDLATGPDVVGSGGEGGSGDTH